MAETMGMLELFHGRAQEGVSTKAERRGPTRELGTSFIWPWQQGELVTGRGGGVGGKEAEQSAASGRTAGRALAGVRCTAPRGACAVGTRQAAEGLGSDEWAAVEPFESS